ncbi:hypothetical protein ACF0H5_005474 [Mactra antiquata]
MRIMFIFCVFLYLELMLTCLIKASDINERLDELEHKVSRIDYSTQTKYLELKRKINNQIKAGGGSISDNDTSTIKNTLKSYDEKIDTFINEQNERSDAIARAVSEEKVLIREVMSVLKDISDSNAESVMEIEENMELYEDERATFQAEWKAFQDEIRNEIKLLKDKIDNMVPVNGNVIVEKKKEPCEDGWTLINNICYHYHTDSMSWYAAAIKCSDYNGKLAEPNTDDKYKTILDIISPGDEVWLGASDMEHEGIWLWENTQKVVDVDKWEQYQPNNLGGNQNCLEIGINSKLNDDACMASNKFVCEKTANLL